MSRSNSPVKQSADAAVPKVFVGNLSFNVTEDELKSFLAQYKPVEVQLKTRRVFNRKDQTTSQRSLGFAFVTFASLKAAQDVVKALNDKEHEGRPLKVEIARPEEPREKKEAPAAGEEDAAKEEKPRRRNNRRRSRKPAESGDEKQADGEEGADEKQSRRRRPTRPKPSLEGRPQSKTQVFISNLAFATTSEQLGDFFKSKGLKVAEAAVVSRRLRSGEERSKGFGFVTFQSEADQKKAVSEVNGVELDGRKINVRVAVERSEEEAAAEAGEQ